jgi:carbon-monoxide dehydrogenase large subunit
VHGQEEQQIRSDSRRGEPEVNTRGSILGRRVRRTEDSRMLTVGGSYIGDLALDGALSVTFVRSTVAHAAVTNINTDAAREKPGVVDVITADDLALPDMPSPIPFADQRMLKPWLASEVVRYVGEPLAVVLSETQALGIDAAELVEIDYEALPVVRDPRVAALEAPYLFPETGTNVAAAIPGTLDEGFFDSCDVVVEATILNQRMAAAPMEPRAAAARWDDEGHLTFWVTSQIPHSIRAAVAAILGLEAECVRVVVPDMGGGFGAKLGGSTEELLVPILSRRARRPVRWIETRSESMINLPHARAQWQTTRLGGSRDGRLKAYSLSVVMDCGAYPSSAPFLPILTRMMTSGVYDLDRVSFESQCVLTNTAPVGAYRGAGRPEATAAIERTVDIFAAEIGMDPAELRRLNFIPPTAFPYETKLGAVYDTGDYCRVMDLVLTAAGYAELRKEQRRRRQEGSQKALGIGISTYVEVTNPIQDSEYGSMSVEDDGSATLRTGSSSHGQGHETTFAQIASELTGIPMNRIKVLRSDTGVIPRGSGTGGSKSLQLGGSAVTLAATELTALARSRAAEMLEADVADVVLDNAEGIFHVAGVPSKSLTWSDIATESPEPLSAEADFKADASTFPFGAHVAVVEVDTETGKVVVKRFVGCDDAGRVINPLIFEGQIHGGIAAGIGQALVEEVRFDDDANPITTNFADYCILSAAELPSFELVESETPTPLNPLGAKGIGESGTIGATPAVQNAVVDALSHLGVRHIDMPLTPENVWRAIRAEAGRH